MSTSRRTTRRSASADLRSDERRHAERWPCIHLEGVRPVPGGLLTGLYPPELLTGRPIFLGAILAVFLGLVAFDVIHARFHEPRGGWLERTGAFRFLRRHHELHHERQYKNFNVTNPLADMCSRNARY